MDLCPRRLQRFHHRWHDARKRSPLGVGSAEDAAMRTMAVLFADAGRYERAQRLGRLAQEPFTRNDVIRNLPGPLAGWSAARDLQLLPRESFRMWWRRRAGQAVPAAGRMGAGDAVTATLPAAAGVADDG